MRDLFGLIDWPSAVLALSAGTALGFIYGLIPGIGGRIALVLSIPLAGVFPPYGAAIFLFALHSIVHTSTSIPAIAWGMPSGSSDTATIVDGYPLAKMGRAGEALGASLSASALGGILGALAFLTAIPLAKPLVTSFGPPEFFMLALFGATMVASLSSEGILQGLIVAVVGVLFAMVGIDTRTGTPRFTFGSVELWDGFNIAALVCGLFVIPEMLSLKRFEGESARERAIATSIRDVFLGMFVTFRHIKVLLRSTLYGIFVGFMPTVGSTVGVWLAYGYAARTTKSDIPFGKGAIAGVIAPEAANNSKEGGAMIPSLFFGIPGSSAMAIMMAALSYVGVAIGPAMMKTNIELAYILAATVILANILAIPLFFAVVPSIVRLSALRRDAIAPLVIVTSVTAALISAPSISTHLQLLLATLLGIGLKAANWPRAPFILGFVIADMGEGAFFHTAAIWGWSALLRPITFLLFASLVVWLIVSLRTRPAFTLGGPRRTTLILAAALIAFFAIVFALRCRCRADSRRCSSQASECSFPPLL
jgi:TctA family transporter